MIIRMKITIRLVFSIYCMLLIVFPLSAAEPKSAAKKEEVKPTKIEETVLGMNVSGNKEAPNLLYIIPWKDSTEHSKPPEINRLMDEVYSTVDPDVYDKELSFYQELTKVNSVNKVEEKNN